MKTSIPRIRSVTEKATGRQIRVLRHHYLNDKKHISERVNALLEGFFSDGKPAGGFALVIWNPDGGHMVAQSAFANSPIPKAVVPDFARNALLLNLSRD